MTHSHTCALLGVVLIGACKDATAPPPGAASVSVAPPGLTLSAGQAAQLTAMERNARGDSFPAAAFLWTSSDTTIVTVSPAGIATARRPGIATVTAHATTSSLTGTAIVTVIPAVGQVWIPWPTDTIAVGDTAYFYAIVYDTAGTRLRDRVQVWSTPDSTLVRATAVPYVGPAIAIGIAQGIARVIVMVEGVADTAFVTVQ